MGGPIRKRYRDGSAISFRIREDEHERGPIRIIDRIVLPDGREWAFTKEVDLDGQIRAIAKEVLADGRVEEFEPVQVHRVHEFGGYGNGKEYPDGSSRYFDVFGDCGDDGRIVHWITDRITDRITMPDGREWLFTKEVHPDGRIRATTTRVSSDRRVEESEWATIHPDGRVVLRDANDG